LLVPVTSLVNYAGGYLLSQNQSTTLTGGTAVSDTYDGQTFNQLVFGTLTAQTSAVPEPADAALLAAGLAVIGLVSRRRREGRSQAQPARQSLDVPQCLGWPIGAGRLAAAEPPADNRLEVLRPRANAGELWRVRPPLTP
jgi:hypothetical protein